MKNLEKINKSFFNKIAKYYDNGIFKNWLTNKQKTMLEIVSIKENSRILDAGCGTGNLLMLLKNHGKNLRLYGIDISEEMLKIAKNKLKNNAELKTIPIEKTDYSDDFFDYIFSTEAFHHYSNINLAMENFYRLLKKNGRLIILDFDFKFFNKIFHLIEPGNNKMHSPKEFRNLFKEYNFNNIQQKRIGLFLVLTAGEK